jgi:hypothetical protein
MLCFYLHARLRVRQASGIPCALLIEGARNFWQNSGAWRGEIAEARQPPSSSPANAGDPVRRGLSIQSPSALEYWVARSSRAMTPWLGLDVDQYLCCICHHCREAKMLIHLPIVILASLPFVPVADSVPKFDIARECEAEGDTQSLRKKCADDEAEARDQVQSEWAQFNGPDKANCISESSIGDAPSYVELLTCLEMARDVRKSSPE